MRGRGVGANISFWGRSNAAEKSISQKGGEKRPIAFPGEGLGKNPPNPGGRAHGGNQLGRPSRAGSARRRKKNSSRTVWGVEKSGWSGRESRAKSITPVKSAVDTGIAEKKTWESGPGYKGGLTAKLWLDHHRKEDQAIQLKETGAGARQLRGDKNVIKLVENPRQSKNGRDSGPPGG